MSLRTIVALTAAAAVLYGLQQTRPGYADITRPLAVTGVAGERLSGREFTVQVTNARLAKRLQVTAYGQSRILTTSGVWLIVNLKAEARNKTVAITAASWRGPTGIQFDASQRLSTFPSLISGQRLEPGIEKSGQVFLEIPPDQLDGGVLLIARGPFIPLDSEITVDLGSLPASVEEISLDARRNGG